MIALLVVAATSVHLSHIDDPKDPDFGVVLALGVNAQVAGTASMLKVYTANGPDDRPAVFGTVAKTQNGLRFTPRFTFVTDLDYIAVFDLPAYCRRVGCQATEKLRLTFRMPDPPLPSKPRVTEVHPLAAVVPANLLRFYVHFSQPMRPMDAQAHVRLYGPNGKPIDDAFVMVRQGLWDRNRRRLTLIVHPGRIKRGVGPNLTQGPVLRAAGRYRLVIDGRLRDATGIRLGADFEHRFEVGPAVRSRLRPTTWLLTAPRTPVEPVVMRADRPLDSALLKRLLRVERLDGTVVQGTVQIGEDARRWAFRPLVPWPPGDYRIIIPRTLEDLAGNTVDYRFEEAPKKLPSPTAVAAGPVARRFSVDTARSRPR